MARAKVISFINYKGGVGKTTTTYHIGCCLAQYYTKKVLLVDIDPQTNLTFLCVTYEKWKEFKMRCGTIRTLYDRFKKKIALDTKRYIWTTPITAGNYRIPNIDLLPCDVDLLGEDLGGGQITERTFPSFDELKQEAKEFLRERMFLKRALSEVEDKYDYILIDCPPNIYLMTQNALVASNWYIITTIPDHLSTIGLGILQNKVGKIAELISRASAWAGEAFSSLKLASLGGIIFVKVRIGGSLIVNTHQMIMEEVKRKSGNNMCFSTYTTELIGYSEAAEQMVPVWLGLSPNAKRAAQKREYEKITEEFLRRF